MKKASILAGAVVLATVGFTAPAFASDGVFDFLDPCIEARDDFNAQRQQAFEELAVDEAHVDGAVATPQYGELWIKAKKEALRPVFEKEVKPQLEAIVGPINSDTAFPKWFDAQLAQLTPDQLSQLQTANFRFELKNQLADKRSRTNKDVDVAHDNISKQCKMDVGNQALRVAILGAMKPLTFVTGNWTSAEKHGFIAQVIKAPTGIDPVDAVKCPIRGCSDKSVVNQGLKALGF